MTRTDPVSLTARRLQVLPLALVAVFFVVPVVSMVTRFVRPGPLFDALTEESLRGVWWFTFWQAGASTLLTLVVGIPLTWAVARFSFAGSRLVTALITVPFFMPAVVVATPGERIESTP